MTKFRLIIVRSFLEWRRTLTVVWSGSSSNFGCHNAFPSLLMTGRGFWGVVHLDYVIHELVEDRCF